MDTKDMREKFEAWAKSADVNLDLSRGNHGSYKILMTHWLYCSWVAAWDLSREVLYVTLPDRMDFEKKGGDYFDGARNGYNQCLDACTVSLKAAGLKVKP